MNNKPRNYEAIIAALEIKATNPDSVFECSRFVGHMIEHTRWMHRNEADYYRATENKIDWHERLEHSIDILEIINRHLTIPDHPGSYWTHADGSPTWNLICARYTRVTETGTGRTIHLRGGDFDYWTEQDKNEYPRRDTQEWIVQSWGRGADLLLIPFAVGDYENNHGRDYTA